MRRAVFAFALAGLLLSVGAAVASEGKVCKVLPQLLDKQGRQSLSPSLYERDAYQAYLRKHPEERSTLQLVVQWKAKGVDWSKLKLRAELRGLVNNSLQTNIMEEPVKKTGWFGNWSKFVMTTNDFQKFGELASWRVTLWEGDHLLSEQESFLWSGVPTASR
jgi:hypothetical protein